MVRYGFSSKSPTQTIIFLTGVKTPYIVFLTVDVYIPILFDDKAN